MVKMNEKRATKLAEKVVEKAVGRNPTLATLAKFYQAQIPVIGVAKVRQKVMDAINDDIRRAVSKNTEPEAARKELLDLLQTAIQTPEYVKLLELVDLGEEHAKIMINEAVDKKWTPTPTPEPEQLPAPTIAVSWWRKLVAWWDRKILGDDSGYRL